MQKKVIITQQDAKDCGVCCLQSMIKYYDGYVPIEQLRKDTKTSLNGTSAFHMVETLKNYGFDAYGSRIKKDKFFSLDFPLPAIVHVVLDNGFNHYMVLYEKRKNKVILMDPSKGKKVMSDTDFFWIWSEIIILAYPKQKISCYGKEKNKLSMMISLLGREKRKFFSLIYIEILSILITVISTFYLKFALKYLNQYYELLIISLFFVLITFFKILIQKETIIRIKNLNRKLGILHTTNYLEHMISLPYADYETRNISDYVTRFWESMELKYLYTDVLKGIILALNILFFSFFCLFFVQETFFHFYVFISLLYFVYQMIFQSQSYHYEYEMIKEKTNFQRTLLDIVKNVPIYYHLSQRLLEKEEGEKSLISYLEKEDQKETFYEHFLCYKNIIKEIANLAIILLGILFIKKGTLEIIDFIIIEEIGNYLWNALEMLVSQVPKEKYLKNIMKKYYEFLNTKIEKINTNISQINLGDIKIEKLTFSYNQYHYILKDVNLQVIKGTHLLLLGSSGCGKSTLCKILTGIYEPTSGTIAFDNQNMRDIHLDVIKNNIIYLPQDSHLITGTIRENILMQRNFNEARFQKVCEICQIEEIVEKKPLRYETTISSNENNLSGGEKQRIMLARTLYTDAQIFLLDESLSEVDETKEKQMIKEMREFLKRKTIIYISHKNYKSLFDDVKKLEVCHERVLIS